MVAIRAHLWEVLATAWAIAWTTVYTIIVAIVLHTPVIGDRYANYLHNFLGMNETKMDARKWVDTCYSLQCWKQRFVAKKQDVLKKVSLHGEFYNAKLHSLDGRSAMLADLLKPTRPLVLNFGSCS